MEPLLHQTTQSQLEALIRHPRAAYIFVGPPGVGKLTAALYAAKRLNCAGGDGDNCQTCRLIDSGNYPDLVTVRPTDKASIGIAEVQQLQQTISLTHYRSQGQRVVVVKSGGLLTGEAQNCLLKTIEEPPSGTVIILLVERLASLLLTVRSRCQVVHCRALPDVQISRYLQTKLALDPVRADQIAGLAAGSVGLAISLSRDSELYESYLQTAALAEQLPDRSKFDRLVLAHQVAESGDDVGQLISVLTSQARRRLRLTVSESPAAASVAAAKLSCLERFRRYRLANVNLKTALSALLVEL